MKNKWKLTASLFFLLVSCQGKMNQTVEKENLLQTDIAFARTSLETNAAEAFKKYLAPDCMMFPDGGDPVQGADKIYQRMKKGAENYVLSWIPRRAEVAASGDMGWTWGTYTLTSVEAKGQPVKSYGKYVNVWQKQADNTWKVMVDIGNESPSPGD